MKVILFGASGMVGQGVLRECLLDPDVTTVVAIGRSPLGRQHEKLREIVRQDLFHYAPSRTNCAAPTPVFSASACRQWE